MAGPDEPSLPPGLPIWPSPLVRFFGPGTFPDGRRAFVGARWIFLRALGAIFFSAFYSLFFQIRGLIGYSR